MGQCHSFRKPLSETVVKEKNRKFNNPSTSLKTLQISTSTKYCIWGLVLFKELHGANLVKWLLRKHQLDRMNRMEGGREMGLGMGLGKDQNWYEQGWKR